MDFKLIVLDVDGTIAGHGKPVKREIAENLQNLEDRGITITLASGKNTSYLSGLARGMGIKRPIVIGENGCVILDPVKMKEIKLIEKPTEILSIENGVVKHFTDSIWLQPNQVELTIFPKDKRTLPEVAIYIKEIIKPFNKKVIMCKHEDAIDILPLGIDKGKAIVEIRRLYNIKKEEIVAVGDSSYDVPMFKEAGLSLIIGNKIVRFESAKRFQMIKEALNFIEDSI